MSQALHTAGTGINAGQSQINVVANNVANINTTAYKTANMTFETLYSKNLSYGSAATKDGGGTNPMQIGLGVKVGGITRNFTPGTFVHTGRDLDTMISGTGFYVVKDSNGASYFTRDGVFILDSDGNLCTQNGMKVAGAKSVYSNAGSEDTVKIPANMVAKVTGDENLGDKTLAELNNASITHGQVGVRIGTTDVELPVGDATTPAAEKTVSQIISDFNRALSAEGITAAQFQFVDNGDGTISYTGTESPVFLPETTTSNFLGETGLSDTNSTSYILHETVSIYDMVNYNDTDAISLKSTSIDENGILVATYNDGSVLTQFVDSANTLQWRYTTKEGVNITGSDVTATGSSIANSCFALELATMVNESGLISTSNNLWEWGPDVGQIYYGIAGEMSIGSIESGGYEESNVDIANELSTMITAQRMIQMNSRVFSTASSVLETLAYLGS